MGFCPSMGSTAILMRVPCALWERSGVVCLRQSSGLGGAVGRFYEKRRNAPTFGRRASLRVGLISTVFSVNFHHGVRKVLSVLHSAI
jgi:hypothetical protein